MRGYVVGIRCWHTLVIYVAGTHWLHRQWVYGGARNVGGGAWCRVCHGCWRASEVCQEHKSVPMTDIVLSLLYLVVMYVYIIA